MVSRKAPGQLTKREKYRDLKEDQNARDLIRDTERDIESLRKWMDLVETSSKEWGGNLTLDGDLILEGNPGVLEFEPFGEVRNVSTVRGVDTGISTLTFSSGGGFQFLVDGSSQSVRVTPDGDWEFNGNTLDLENGSISNSQGMEGNGVTTMSLINGSVIQMIGNDMVVDLGQPGGPRADFYGFIDLQNNSLNRVSNIVNPTDTTRDVAMAGLVEQHPRLAGGSETLSQGTASRLAAGSRFAGVDFVDGSTTAAIGNIQVPEAVWRYGTSNTATIKLYWAPLTTDTGVVRWVAYLGFQVAEGVQVGSAGAVTLPSAEVAANGTANEVQVTTLTTSAVNWTATGTNTSRTLGFRVDRVGGWPSDTFLGTARLIAWEITWDGDFTT